MKKKKKPATAISRTHSKNKSKKMEKETGRESVTMYLETAETDKERKRGTKEQKTGSGQEGLKTDIIFFK